MKPIIGVLPLWDDEKDSLWMLPGYFNGILRAGGVPVMLPLSSEPSVIEQEIQMCDGFLFTGGHDVSPELYGVSRKYPNVICCKKRDEMEGALMKRALEENKSILGICRGIQFLNVYLGGSLYQDLPTEHPSDINHHQDIKMLAPGLNVMAQSEDGLIEAVYMPDKRFVWALQWHPEFAYETDVDSMKLFRTFVNSASPVSCYQKNVVLSHKVCYR